jgi:hypothetical protein
MHHLRDEMLMGSTLVGVLGYWALYFSLLSPTLLSLSLSLSEMMFMFLKTFSPLLHTLSQPGRKVNSVSESVPNPGRGEEMLGMDGNLNMYQ